MRSVLSALALGVVVAAVPAAAEHRDASNDAARQSEMSQAPRAVEASLEAFPVQRLLAALRHLRLRPGHDGFDRPAAPDRRTR